MNNTNESYRIRTNVGESDGRLNIDLPLTQTYDTFDILSLKLNQKNQYKYFDSNYGLVVGRVLANNGFGIPNAKISIFIEFEESTEDSIKKQLMYRYTSAMSMNLGPEEEQTISVSGGQGNIRYNLLPDFVDNECHQDVGTFPNKRLVLDNNDVIEVFEKYYKYTTTSNESGDYMIYGVPTGSQTLHVDIDLSDIGILSQRPRDLIYQGYPANLFDSPNKFKSGTDLNSLSQIYSQNKGITVYPYWGNSNNEGDDASNIAITRCDIKIEYEFKPTAIFLGCMVTDRGANAIGKNCTGTNNLGRMSDLSAGEGDIEMIRKTLNNRVEQYRIKGDRLIDGDGVWCYQIPMNLDYVMTDEFGNMVQTDDPSKGIPTRARVRFRFTLDEAVNDATGRKRCKYLVPNNPRMDKDLYPNFYKTHEADYEFGSATQDESYCDMLWNNVYTVKNYIPRLQKNNKVRNWKHTGIKKINYSGDNLEMPFNSLSIKLSFVFKLICVLIKTIIYFIAMINLLLGTLLTPFCLLCSIFKGMSKIPLIGFIFKPLKIAICSLIFECIKLGSEFCDDGIRKVDYYPGCWGCQWKETLRKHKEQYKKVTNPEEHVAAEAPKFKDINSSSLMTCIENNLAQDNEAVSFNFQNDWINGTLYAPLWYRKILKKKNIFFGLIKLKAKDNWCRSDRGYDLRLFQACSLEKDSGESIQSPITGKQYNIPKTVTSNCGGNCHKAIKTTNTLQGGLILTKQNKNENTIYYYKAVEYNAALSRKKNQDGVILLFATDIVLLGSLNDCDLNGTPQFYKYLEPTTYNMPSDILFTDTVIEVDSNGEVLVGSDDNFVYEHFSESTGCDWGNLNSISHGGDECGKQGKDQDGGLFYGIGCLKQEMRPKSCLNLPRICEFGVSLDEAKDIPNLSALESSNADSSYERLAPDGFVSKDELYNIDERSMFATLNGNRLRTKLSERTGLKEYDLRYLYCNNFDGLMYKFMRHTGDCTYKNNYKLETLCKDYYMFRMGTEPFYYDTKNSIPRYENSFYFYFGLKRGKTAIEKFNGQFFSACEDVSGSVSPYTITSQPNSWCTDMTEDADGYILMDLSEVSKPCDITIESNEIMSFRTEFSGIVNDKVYLGVNDFMHDENGDRKEEFIDAVDLNINASVYMEGGKLKLDDKGTSEIETIDMIPNGTYTITIVDSEGTIMTSNVDLMPQSLSVSVEKETFIIPNNQKLNTFGDDIKGLLSAIVNGASSQDKDVKKYGGYIAVKNIINGEDSSGKYKLLFNINPNSEYKYFKSLNDGFGYSFDITFKADEEGNITSIEGDNNFNTFFVQETRNKMLTEDADGNKMFVIPVPEGDVTYQITVIELCSVGDKDVESGNKITMNVMVNDTTPFKLYINDVDVSAFRKDIFGDNRYLGWDNVEKVSNGDCYAVTDANISSLELSKELGWLHLSNPNNYVWENLEGYNEVNEAISTTENNIKDRINELFDQTDIDCAIYNFRDNVKPEQVFNALDEIFKVYRDEYDKVIEEFAKTISGITCDNSINIEDEVSLFYEFFEEYYNAIDDEKTFKSEFIQSVKNTFWLTCPQGSKDIILDVRTSFMPIEYYLGYQEEAYDENSNNVGVISNNGTVVCGDTDDGYYVENIIIPTITSVDNKTYGYDDPNDRNNVYHKGELCFGYDRINGLDKNGKYQNVAKHFKKPYTVWIRNGQGEALPYAENAGNNNKQTSKPFSFHIIDKSLRFNMLSWGYVNNYPYYYSGFEINNSDIDATEFIDGCESVDQNYQPCIAGNTVSIPGLACGLFYNGILNAKEEFNELSFNSNKNAVGFFTKDGDTEDSIPTKRQIYDNNIFDKTNDNRNYYAGYKVGNISNKETTYYLIKKNNKGEEYEEHHLLYLQVPNRKTNLSIEDSSCSIDNTIYGNMRISLSSDSVHDCKVDRAALNFNLVNGDDNNDNKFMMVNANKYPHPFLALRYYTPSKEEVEKKKMDDETIESKSYYYFDNKNDDKNDVFKVENYDYGILDYEMTNDTIISNGGGGVFTGYDSEEDEEGNVTTIKNPGWCKSGNFITRGRNDYVGTILNGRDSNTYYYCVVSTSNNCKIYSPLYSFKPLKLNYGITKFDNGSYALRFRFISGDDNNYADSTNFYIRHYDFTLEYSYSAETNSSGTIQIENDGIDVNAIINDDKDFNTEYHGSLDEYFNAQTSGQLFKFVDESDRDGKYQIYSSTPHIEVGEAEKINCDNSVFSDTEFVLDRYVNNGKILLEITNGDDVANSYYEVYKIEDKGELTKEEEISESELKERKENGDDKYYIIKSTNNGSGTEDDKKQFVFTYSTGSLTNMECYKVKYTYVNHTLIKKSNDDPTVRHYKRTYYSVLPENVGSSLSRLLGNPAFRRFADDKFKVWITDASGLRHLCKIKYKAD